MSICVYVGWGERERERELTEKSPVGYVVGGGGGWFLGCCVCELFFVTKWALVMYNAEAVVVVVFLCLKQNRAIWAK